MSSHDFILIDVASLVFALLLDVLLILGTWRKGAINPKRRLLQAALLMHLVAIVGSLISWILNGQSGNAVRTTIMASANISNIFGVLTCTCMMMYVYTDAGKRDAVSERSTLMQGDWPYVSVLGTCRWGRAVWCRQR